MYRLNVRYSLDGCVFRYAGCASIENLPKVLHLWQTFSVTCPTAVGFITTTQVIGENNGKGAL